MQDEIYDIFDKSGKMIGKATWTEVHTKGLIHQTAGVIIFKDESKKETLIQKRSSTVKQDPDLWQQSASGHIITGDNPDKTIKQEIKEELFNDEDLPNMTIKKITVFENSDIPNNHEIFHLYEAIYPGPFKFSEEEVSKIKWVRWDFLLNDMKKNPKNYTQAFHNIMKAYLASSSKK